MRPEHIRWTCIRCCHYNTGWFPNHGIGNMCEMCGGLHTGHPLRPHCAEGAMRGYLPRDYALAFPDGAWAVRGDTAWLPGSVMLIPGTGPHAALPGGYLHVFIRSDMYVVITDSDDGIIEKPHATWESAEQTMRELKDLSPFSMQELVACEIGFIWG